MSTEYLNSEIEYTAGAHTYVAYPAKPQANGVQHCLVDHYLGGTGNGQGHGRLTRRPDAPGWFAVDEAGSTGVLRDGTGTARYFPTPEAALEALAQATELGG